MLPFEDPRWSRVDGGYGQRFDPRPYLSELSGGHRTSSLETLWENLYHQGTVGIASYLAVPHLLEFGAVELAAAIEAARSSSANPLVPEWFEPTYQAAIRSRCRGAEWPSTESELLAEFSLVASTCGAGALSRALALLDEDEVQRILADYESAV